MNFHDFFVIWKEITKEATRAHAHAHTYTHIFLKRERQHTIVRKYGQTRNSTSFKIRAIHTDRKHRQTSAHVVRGIGSPLRVEEVIVCLCGKQCTHLEKNRNILQSPRHSRR